MSFCAACTPERSERRPAAPSPSRLTRAARRRTASRARTPIITANASVPVARKTSAVSMVEALSPNRPNVADASMVDVLCLDLEVDHLEHDEIAEQHPAGGRAEQYFGQLLVPNGGVEFRRDELDDQKHADRQRRQDHGRGAALGGERVDLAPHLEALANDARKALEDFAEIAAGRALDGHRGDEQR